MSNLSILVVAAVLTGLIIGATTLVKTANSEAKVSAIKKITGKDVTPEEARYITIIIGDR